MPCRLQDAIAELDQLLQPERFEDYCPNGLQFPGKNEIRKLATGVTASAELFERAIASQADLLVVHHGLFWGSTAIPIDNRMKRRLKLLFDSDMSLAAYHLPLDAHPQVGNNALIARALGADTLEPFALHDGEPIGFIARFPGKGIDAKDLFARVTTSPNEHRSSSTPAPSKSASWRSSPVPATTTSRMPSRQVPTPSSPASPPSA